MSRMLILVLLIPALATCDQADRDHFAANGVALLYNDGRAQFIDTKDRRTFGIKWQNDELPRNIRPLIPASSERCVIKVYGVSVDGKIVNRSLLVIKEISVRQRYSDSDFNAVLKEIGIEALRDPRVCAGR